jgi:hypothetical protein
MRLVLRTLLVLVGLIVVWQAPQAFGDAAHDVRSTSGRSHEERAAEPVRAQDLPVEAFVRAARIIPEDATYYTTLGIEVSLTETQRAAAEPLLRYWLLPRRATTLDRADWVVGYGADLDALGVELDSRSEVAPGLTLARVVR